MTVMKDISLRNVDNIEPERAVLKLQGYQADSVLSSYFRLPQLLKYVECFTGKDIAAMHTMLINKVYMQSSLWLWSAITYVMTGVTLVLFLSFCVCI